MSVQNIAEDLGHGCRSRSAGQRGDGFGPYPAAHSAAVHKHEVRRHICRLSDRIALPMAPVDHGNPYRTIGDGVVCHLDFLYRFRASGAV
jgi:hypothetical protein